MLTNSTKFSIESVCFLPDDFSIIVNSSGATILHGSGNLNILAVGALTLDSDGGSIAFQDDGASHFLFDCDNTAITIYDDTNTSDYCKIQVAANGATTISTVDNDGESGWLALQPDGDLILNSKTGRVTLYDSDNLSDFSRFDVDSNGALTISTYDAAGSDADIIIDADGDITLDSSTGVFIAKKAGTEFSVANSAYAGMILGYRMIGEDAAHDTYTITTSYAVPDSAMTVRFIAPPSGAVEIMVQFLADGASGRVMYVGLSDNATYNSLGATYEHTCVLADESDVYTHQHYWTITGLTAGSTYNYWFGAKGQIASGNILWGGSSGDRYSDFIMKATALPSATSDFAEYD